MRGGSVEGAGRAKEKGGGRKGPIWSCDMKRAQQVAEVRPVSKATCS